MSVLFPLLLLLSSLTLSALAQATCSAAMAPYILPSLNTTQKLAISSPPQGAEVFDTTQGALNVYSGTTWQMLNPSFPDGLAISSTTAALVPPTMNTTQKTAIANPPEGGVVFDTTQDFLNVYSGTTWQSLGPTWVYGGSTILTEAISVSANTQTTVLEVVLTSPTYGTSWSAFATWGITGLSGGDNTYGGFVAFNGGEAFAPGQTATSGTDMQFGFSGSGFSYNGVSPNTAVSIILYTYANVAFSIGYYYLTPNIPTYIQVVWVSWGPSNTADVVY